MSIEDELRRLVRELQGIREALERLAPPEEEPRTFVTSRQW